MSKIEKILSIILVCLFLVSITSCVTKKKLKESQDLQTTYLLDQTETKFLNSVNILESKITNRLSSDFNEKLKLIKESSSSNENESTNVTVNITAEDGKEKSATVGNTTVTSNGADVTVKTSSTKAINKQIETLNSEWSQKYNLLETSLVNVTNELNEFKEAQLKVNEDLKSKSETKTKETNKSGVNFWWVFIPILILVVYLVYRFYGTSIVGKFKGWF